MIALIAILGAVAYRVRGGAYAWLLPGGTQFARLVWAVPTGFLCGVLTGDPVVGVACMGVAFLGLMIPHGWAQNDDVLGLFGMSAVTLGRVAMLAAGPYARDGVVWYPAAVLALLAGPAYWVGYRLPKLGDSSGLNGGTEWGEFFTGGLIWLGLLIAGTPT